mmetsp:Transcript_16593/g.29769  ORF Transcript_16593/g.29769 Transcript_16593/m.29769 type:complete len:146 (+) Transcript_16593:125-562(+)
MSNAVPNRRTTASSLRMEGGKGREVLHKHLLDLSTKNKRCRIILFQKIARLRMVGESPPPAKAQTVDGLQLQPEALDFDPDEIIHEAKLWAALRSRAEASRAHTHRKERNLDSAAASCSSKHAITSGMIRSEEKLLLPLRLREKR